MCTIIVDLLESVLVVRSDSVWTVTYWYVMWTVTYWYVMWAVTYWYVMWTVTYWYVMWAVTYWYVVLCGTTGLSPFLR